MSISLKKSGMLKLGLSLGGDDRGSQRAGKTTVYCSEGSPEGFNPQLFTSGTTYDASSVPIYNRTVEFKTGTTEIIPGPPRSGTSATMAKPTPSTCVKA